MALTSHGKPIWDQDLNDRQRQWIYGQLLAQYPPVLQSLPAGQESQHIQKNLSDSSALNNAVLRLRNIVDEYLLPEAMFDWVTEEYRVTAWIQCSFWYGSSIEDKDSKTYELPFISEDFQQGSAKKNLMYMFDIWYVDPDVKRSGFNLIRQLWSELLVQDEKYKWLNQEDDQQVKWAWKYLSDRNPEYRKVKHEMNSPLKTIEFYHCVLSVFDRWLGHPAECQQFLQKMKQAWNQQKYRNNLEGKVICNFVLKKEVKNKLNQLAARSELKINEKLERMINKEYANMNKS